MNLQLENKTGSGGQNTSAANEATGEPRRSNRWYPVFCSDDRMLSPPMDWVCPTCGELLRGGKTCPHCGLAAREHPPGDWRYQKRKENAWARFGHDTKHSR